MIIISAQPNRHFSYSGGAQKKCKENKKKQNELFSFNRTGDKQPIVFHLMMMIR